MNTIICDAIRNHKLVEFQYKKMAKRIVEPYIYGLDRYGREVLSGYQTHGYSRSKSQGWKTFIIAEIFKLNVTEQSFTTPRPDYNSGDPRFKQLFCRFEIKPSNLK